MTNENRNKKLAIVGASGVVGRELLEILEWGPLKISQLDLFASKKSAGETISFRDEDLVVKELTSPEQISSDIAFFAAGSRVSNSFVEKVAERGTICIDKSSAFRMRDD